MKNAFTRALRGACAVLVFGSLALMAHTSGDCDPPPPPPCKSCPDPCYLAGAIKLTHNGVVMPPFPYYKGSPVCTPGLYSLSVKTSKSPTSAGTNNPASKDDALYSQSTSPNITGLPAYRGRPDALLPVGGTGGWTGELPGSAIKIDCCGQSRIIIKVVMKDCDDDRTQSDYTATVYNTSGSCTKNIGTINLQFTP